MKTTLEDKLSEAVNKKKASKETDTKLLKDQERVFLDELKELNS